MKKNDKVSNYVNFLKDFCSFLPNDFDNTVERVYEGEDRNYLLLEEIYKIACDYVKNNSKKNYKIASENQRKLYEAELFVNLWECCSDIDDIVILNAFVLEMYNYDIKIENILNLMKFYKIIHKDIERRESDLILVEEENDE